MTLARFTDEGLAHVFYQSGRYLREVELPPATLQVVVEVEEAILKGVKTIPYKSKAQQRAMHDKASRGEIAQSTVKEFDAATNFKALPEKVKPKGKKK